ncbi:MAG TPA: APC family permease [Phototrophicaceae bacterium]|jgi:amino acid transporter|nr:APC family permease [Phototrophicaceae bacterium]
MRNIRDLIIGPPLATARLTGERLDNFRALAALSPDALSSIAYANQEIYLGLAVAGSAALTYSIWIALAITVLLIILTVSYSQTIIAYPTGGGSYTVARENLGKLPGLVAAASLLIDYVLTAAVSLTAGVAAIASAFPVLWTYRVEVALILLLVITIANLRGLREAGTVIAVPVYLFLGAYFIMIGYGIFRAITEGPGAPPILPSTIPAAEPLTIFLILKTFSSGCTALTGVEAISNGVSIFHPPESKNARRTLLIMALFMGVLLLGSIGLTQYFGITAGADETILSALARHIFGSSPLYYFVQITVLLMLVVAANTSFVDFPRVGSLLAHDGYLPRQLTSLGDRLVFSNGIILLSVLVAALIVIFGGDSHALIPLFAVGVFLAFTLSQAGMVVHWLRLQSEGWKVKAFLNGLGAVTTGITFLVVAASKFHDGAWIIGLMVPLLVLTFRAIEQHYQEIGPQLSLRSLTPQTIPLLEPRVVIPVAGTHRGVLKALQMAKSISNNVTAVYIEINPALTAKMRQDWDSWGQDVPLIVLQSPYRSVIRPLIDYLEQTDREHNDGQSAILVLAEFIPAHWWQNLLHNQTAWAIKLTLMYQRRLGSGRIIIDVPFHLH